MELVKALRQQFKIINVDYTCSNETENKKDERNHVVQNKGNMRFDNI
jgi:hypothetical protein